MPSEQDRLVDLLSVPLSAPIGEAESRRFEQTTQETKAIPTRWRGDFQVPHQQHPD
jgi:hypothetical protein